MLGITFSALDPENLEGLLTRRLETRLADGKRDEGTSGLDRLM